ncbi:MAG: 5-oxoprolinase subunit PxpB [Beijerinckiaceae bacterium]
MPPPLSPRFLASGDSAVTVEFGHVIDPDLNGHVLALDAALAHAALPGLVETIPTYRSLLIQFDPLVLDYDVLESHVRALCQTLEASAKAARRWKIPVVYGGAFGIDLDDTAAHHNITPAQLIDKHAGGIYRVYMIGFMPGLAYLGGLDPAIATPRRLDPRLKTPSGTISIGGIQALVASVEMPSGWHLLGRTPVRTWAPGRDPEFLLLPGDEVVFHPIDASRWDALDRAAAAGDIIAEQVSL